MSTGERALSTSEQADSGVAGLDAQRMAITVEADRQGWSVEFVTDAGLWCGPGWTIPRMPPHSS